MTELREQSYALAKVEVDVLIYLEGEGRRIGGKDYTLEGVALWNACQARSWMESSDLQEVFDSAGTPVRVMGAVVKHVRLLPPAGESIGLRMDAHEVTPDA
jgi:hypothetical protein